MTTPIRKRRAICLPAIDWFSAILVTALLFGVSQTSALTLDLPTVAGGLSGPVAITHAGDSRLFVVEPAGRIRIIEDGSLLGTAFLDIDPLVGSGGERGLLGVAFHPDYANAGAAGEGLFWVNYTNNSGNTVIARYSVSANNPNVAEPGSALVLLTIVQTAPNHNGGELRFGPSEGEEQKQYLYIGMGDGGGSGDPNNAGQTDSTLLGKMLRIDPSTEAEPTEPFYAIPTDNPDAQAGLELGMIWAKGLRNPWRFSFDALTGDLYIADVGQGRREEINLTRAGGAGGLNYGWNTMEGILCFNPRENCDMSSLTLPVFDYQRAAGRCAIIGGFVYRGQRFPSLSGVYLYADYCSREIFRLDETSPGVWQGTPIFTAQFRPRAFGEDANGELYVAGADGRVHQVVDRDFEPLSSLPAGLAWYSPAVRTADEVTCGALRELAMATDVARLNANSQLFESCDETGDSFSVRTGEGYLLTLPVAVNFVVQGVPDCPLVDLKPGLNLVGVPDPASRSGCFDLLERIGTNTVVASIQRFNQRTATLESCVFRENSNVAEGNDFPIVAGDAYLIAMKAIRNAVKLDDSIRCPPAPPQLN